MSSCHQIVALMRILFVNSTRHWAGIKTWMNHLAGFLHERGHHVHFVCRPEDRLVRLCEERQLPCTPLQFGVDYNPWAILQLRRIIRQEQIELVVTNISKDVRSGGLAAWLEGVVHVNRLGLSGDLKTSRRMQWEYQRWVDEVMVPSQTLKATFEQRPELRGRVVQFPNVAKQMVDRPQLNSVLQFALVANLSRRKQVHHILQQLAELPSWPWHLHIGGFGPEEEHLRELTHQLKLTSRVSFHGFVEPYQFLPDKDVALLYSTDDEMPNTILEYMSCGCAIVASDLPGVREVVHHRQTGWLVDPYQPQTLREALQALLEQPGLRQELGQAALDYAREHHHLPQVFRRIEAHFADLIALRSLAGVV